MSASDRFFTTEGASREKLVRSFAGVVAPWGPFFGITYYFLLDRPITAALLMTSGFLGLATPWVLKKTDSMTIAGNYLTTVVFAAVLLCICSLGDRPVAPMMWLTPLPLMNVYLVGRRSGAMWTIASIVVIVVVAVLKYRGLLAPSGFTAREETLLIAADLVALVILSTSYAIVYGMFKSEAIEQLELERSKSYQSSKMAALGEMAGSIAHEINNPLTVIRLQSDHLRDLVEAGQHNAEVLEAISRRISMTTTRIANIVRGLRSFSRDADGDPFVEASLSDVLKETLQFCEERFRGSSVEVRVANSVEARAFCRPVQISQVLLNLLNNSYDAVAALPGKKWIRLEIVQDQVSSRIVVSDNGRGIAPEVREKLFQPFFTTKSVGKGTGLGLSLSLSRGIIESHNGTLTFESDCPHTTFVISLPR